MKRFRIIKNYHDEEDEIFLKSNIGFKEGLTVLVGCNGSGKTTLLNQIHDQCQKRELPVVYYNNLTEGNTKGISKFAFHQQYQMVANLMCASEGEQIVLNLQYISSEIRRVVMENDEKKDIFILLDGIDSGLSVDNVIDLKEYFFKFIIKDITEKGIKLYVIVAANEYELARGEQCFNVRSCKYVDIPDYETYRQMIIETRKAKDRRYNVDEFKFE